MSNYLNAAVQWKNESEIRWIRCANWATGGSVTLANKGHLNEALLDLLGNDKFVMGLLLDLKEGFEDHLVDEEAHAEAVAAHIARALDEWAIPPSKITESLDPDTGIADDDVRYDAGIAESKLALSLKGEVRPPVVAAAEGTYDTTRQLAQDLRGLYHSIAGNTATAGFISDLGKAQTPSGWLLPLPEPGGVPQPGTLSGAGSRLAFFHTPEGRADAHALVQGLLLRVSNVMALSAEAFDEDFPAKAPALRNHVLELGAEPTTFGDLSLPPVYAATDAAGAVRCDTILLEVWRETVDRDHGYVFPLGCVQWDNAGYLPNEGGKSPAYPHAFLKYRHTDRALPVSSPAFRAFAADPANLLGTGEKSELVQWRYRVRAVAGKAGVFECAPQGTLPVALDRVQSGDFEFTVSTVGADNGLLTLVPKTASLGYPTTGNPVRLQKGNQNLPVNLAEGVTYYIQTPDPSVPQRVRLCATPEDAFDLDGGAFLVPPAGDAYDFTVKLAVVVPQPKSVVGAGVTDLFSVDGAAPVGVADNPPTFLHGTAVTLSFTGTVAPEGAELPQTWEDNKNDYFVNPLSDGFVELLQHESPSDPATPLRKIAIQADAQGKLTIQDPDLPEWRDIVLLSKDTVRAGAVRSNRPWRVGQKVRLLLESASPYGVTQDGPFDPQAPYFVMRLRTAQGADAGRFALAKTRADADAGRAVPLVEFKDGEGTTTVAYAGVFVPDENDPGLFSAEVPFAAAAETTRVFALPLAQVFRRNAGIYHPDYNPAGSAWFVRDVPGLTEIPVGADEEIASVAACFKPENVAVYRFVKEADRAEGDTAYAYAALSAVYEANPLGYAKNAFVSGSDTWYRTGYSAFAEEGKAVGVSGRPDGLFYDIADPGDVFDARHRVSLSGTDAEALLAANADALFRGVSRSAFREQVNASGAGTGVYGTEWLQTDVLGTQSARDAAPATSPSRLVNRRSVARRSGATLVSNDEADGLRRVWSDRPADQVEMNTYAFGVSFGTVGDAPAGFTDPDSVGGVNTKAFATQPDAKRLSVDDLVHCDYEIWKYRSFADGTTDETVNPQRVNRYALVTVRLTRSGKASGDFGATAPYQRVRFAGASEDAVYRIVDLTPSGNVVLAKPVALDAVEIGNRGLVAHLRVRPFAIPAPLAPEKTYYLFPDPSGGYHLAESLAPAYPEELVDFVVDETLAQAHPAAVKPVFGPWAEAFEEGTTFFAGNVANGSYFLSPTPVSTGTPVKIERFVAGANGKTAVKLPQGLKDLAFAYVVADGRVTHDARSFYRLRLAATPQQAASGDYLDFGRYVEDAGNGQWAVVAPPNPGGVIVLSDLHADAFRVEAVPVSAARFQPSDAKAAKALRTGTPVTVASADGTALPRPLVPDTPYWVDASDEGFAFASSLENLLSGEFVELEGAYTGTVALKPVSRFAPVVFEAGVTHFETSAVLWRTGAALSIVPLDEGGHGVSFATAFGAGMDPLLDADTTYYAVMADQNRLLLAASAEEALAGQDLRFKSRKTGRAVLVPVGLGLRPTINNMQGNDAYGTLTLEDAAFWSRVPTGWAVKLAAWPDMPGKTGQQVPSALATGREYFLAPSKTHAGKYVLCETYADAKAQSGTAVGMVPQENLQFVGWPAILPKNSVSGVFTVPSDASIPVGTPVVLEHWEGDARYGGRLFPDGLFRNKVYYVRTCGSGQLTLGDTLRDALARNGNAPSGQPVMPAYAVRADLPFTIRPVANVEETTFETFRRIDEVVSTDGVAPETGTPVALVPTGVPSTFPVVTGVEAGQVLYAVQRSPATFGLAKTLEDAAACAKATPVRFENDPSKVDPSARFEAVLDPVGEEGDPLSGATLALADAKPSESLYVTNRRWKTGTPVTFSGATEASGLANGETYHIVVHRVVEGNTPTVELRFAKSVAAAYLYDRYVPISDLGEGSVRLVPVNVAETLRTGGASAVYLDTHYDAYLRNTLQTGQIWATAMPVKAENVGRGRMPQYFTESLNYAVGVVADLPIRADDAELDIVGDETVAPNYADDETVEVKAVGNDVPEGLSLDTPYFISGVSASDDGQTLRFKLATSYHEALLGGGADIRWVSDGAYLAVSAWPTPDSESVGLGAGMVDIVADTVAVQGYWPTGTPVKFSVTAGGSLPQGIEGNGVYFTHMFSPGKIRILRDLSAYYRHLFTTNLAATGATEDEDETFQGLGFTNAGALSRPAILKALRVERDNPQSDAYALPNDRDVEVRFMLDRTSYYNDPALPASVSKLSYIDRVRVGSVELTPPAPDAFFRINVVADGATQQQSLDAVIPAAPDDAGVVEVALRKSTATGVKWSEPRLVYRYPSGDGASVQKIRLFRVTPAAVTPGWDNAVQENPDEQFWTVFGGRVSLIAYVPQELQGRALAVKFSYDPAATAPIAATVEETEFYGSNVTVEAIAGTPFSRISCAIELPPRVYNTDHPEYLAASRLAGDEAGGEEPCWALAMSVTVVDGGTGKASLSENDLAFTYYSKFAPEEAPFVVDVSNPLRADNDGHHPWKETVFGFSGREENPDAGGAYLRFVVPGYQGGRTVVYATPVGGGTPEAVPAYPSLEKWNGQTIPVLYAKIPVQAKSVRSLQIRLGSGLAKSLLAARTPYFFELPLRATASPVVQHTLAPQSQGGELLVFAGSNLGAVEDVIFQNEGASTAIPDALRMRRVRIVRKSDTEVAVVSPPYTPKAQGSNTVRVAFCSPDGTGYTSVTYPNPAIDLPAPVVYGVEPQHLYYPSAAYNQNGALLSGVPVCLHGEHLARVSKVWLTLETGAGKGVVDQTSVEVTNLRSNAHTVWFNLPELTGIRKTNTSDKIVYRVHVETQDGYQSYTEGGSETRPALYLVWELSADYEANRPVIHRMTPRTARNTESFQVVLRGKNFVNAVAVRFGQQVFYEGQFVKTQGIGDADDTIQFFSAPTAESGIVAVSVKTRAGTDDQPKYFTSNPVYFNLTTAYYADLSTEGVGTMTVKRTGFTDETVLRTKVKKALSVFEVTQDLPSGVPVKFSGVGSGGLPTGLSADRVYYTVKVPYRRAYLYAINKDEETVVDLSAPNARANDACLLVHLPTKPSEENPEDYEVDWDKNLLRYVERISLDPATGQLDAADNSLLVKSSFWTTDATVAISVFDPVPFTGFELTADAADDPVVESRLTNGTFAVNSDESHVLWAGGLPIWAPFEGWKTLVGGGAGFQPLSMADREYRIRFQAVPTYFVGVSTSLADAISDNPTLVPVDSNADFNMHILDADLAELFAQNQILPAVDQLKSAKGPAAPDRWRDGVCVRLGSKLPTPLADGGLYRTRRFDYGLGLALSETGTADGEVLDLKADGYGFARVTTAYPELSKYKTYYAEDAGGGRIRLYETFDDLLDGNPLRFAVANDTEMVLRPVADPTTFAASATTVDPETGRVKLSTPRIVTGSAVTVEPADELSALPTGFEAGRTYWVFRDTGETVRLYRTWKAVATLGSAARGLAYPTIDGDVVMTPNFQGESLAQTLYTPPVYDEDGGETTPAQNGNLNLYASTVAFQTGGIAGTPVRLTSDKTAFDYAAMTDAAKRFDAFFTLRYPSGGGLTDRCVARAYEEGAPVARLAPKTPGDAYVVKDARFKAVSTGGAPYWEDCFERLGVERVKDFVRVLRGGSGQTPPVAVEPTPSDLNALKGFLRGWELLDGVFPGGFGMGELLPDETTFDLDDLPEGQNSVKVYYDELLPPQYRGRDVYLAALALRVDYDEAATTGGKQTIYTKTAYAGLPFRADAYDPATVFSKVEVAWHRTQRYVEFKKGSGDGGQQGEEQIAQHTRVTYRLGFAVIDKTGFQAGATDPNTRAAVETDPTLTEDYTGGFTVGYVWESRPQCREVYLTSAKRLLQASGAEFQGWTPPDWPSAQAPVGTGGGEYSDPSGFAGLVWLGAKDEDGNEVLYAAFTPGFLPSFVEGAAPFALEGLVKQGATATATGTPIVDALYFAGWKENPRPVLPPKPEYENSAAAKETFIFYRRPVPQWASDGTARASLLPEPFVILSVAGSGSLPDADGALPSLCYPYLGFHVPVPFHLSNYGVGGFLADPDTGRRVVEDATYVRIPAQNDRVQSDRATRAAFAPTKTRRPSGERAGQGWGAVPFTAFDGGSVVEGDEGGEFGPHGGHAYVPVGTRAFAVDVTVAEDKGQLVGCLAVRDGGAKVEAAFPLMHRPLVKPRQTAPLRNRPEIP